MKIAICDDQPLMCEVLQKHLQEYAKQNQIVMEIEIFYKGSALVSAGLDFDILFLDIELGQEHGIKIAEQYMENHTGYIIFLTSHIEEMPNLICGNFAVGGNCNSTHDTRMAERGMDPKVLQYIMGHSNIAVTMEVYNHITEVRRIENEILKMEDLMAM